MNDKFLEQLSRLTRYGLLDSTRTRASGLLVTGSQGQRLSIEVEQIARAIDGMATASDYDYISATERLMAGPIPDLPSRSDELLRLRSYLLFASGPARPWARDTNARRTAVGRTYQRSAQKFGYYEELTDGMRAQLLREVTDALADSVKMITVSQTESADRTVRPGRPPTEDAYVTQEYHGTRIEPRPGEPLRNRHRRTIRALRDGVSEFRQIMTFSWKGTKFPNHSIIGLGEFYIENASDRIVNGEPYYQYELVIPTRHLRAGESTLVAWDVDSPTDEDYYQKDDRLKIFGIGPRGTVETATVTVDFDPDRLPATAWRLDGLPRDAENILNHPAATPIDVAPHLKDVWKGLHPGRIVGFRWRW